MTKKLEDHSLDEAEALSQKVKYFYDIFYSFLCD